MAEAKCPSLRVPPHSMEAEQAVLGAVLVDNGCWERLGADLAAADFYAADHAAIWRACAGLLSAGKPADVITVYAATEGQDHGHDLAYLNELAQQGLPGPAVSHYAAIVRERALRRALMRVAMELDVGACGAGGANDRSASALADEAITALMALQQRGAPSEPRPMRELLVSFLDDLSARAEGRTGAVESGLTDLDRITAGGGRPGELWVIGARPSMGKTALMLTLARNVGRQHQVLVLTQEDSLLTLTARHVAAAGGINLADLRDPRRAEQRGDADLWRRVQEGVDIVAPLRIDTDDQGGLTVADVRRKMQQTRRARGGLALVVLDYLQLMVGQGDNRNQMLGEVAYGLQRAARDLHCWVVLLSQLSRKADERPGPPQMSDLRDSGDIEGAAHLIGMLYRECMRKPATDANRNLAELHVCKQKNGPTDTVKLWFDGATQRFAGWPRSDGGGY